MDEVVLFNQFPQQRRASLRKYLKHALNRGRKTRSHR